MTNHIVLHQPEIPVSAGNIVCMRINTDIHLHLIKPLGLGTGDKALKGAGLDHWEFVDITYHDGIEAFLEATNGEYYLLTKFGRKTYSDFDFSNHDKDFYLIFGKGVTGLPDWVEEKYRDTTLRIPMSRHIRSLNLSNTTALLTHEALRQQDFPGLN